MQDANGKQLLMALAAGCEMMERASRAANPSLRNRGFHTTPTCGVFGATVAAGKLLELTPRKLVSALGLAGAQSCGPDGNVRAVDAEALQSRAGGARRRDRRAMAQLGFTGTDTIFEGERGFLKAFSDERTPQALSDGLEATLPSSTSNSSRIRARGRSTTRSTARWRCARQDRARRCEGDRGDRLRRGIRTGRTTIRTRRPQTYHEAQVSLPFSVAVAMIEGKALLEAITATAISERRK